MRGDNGTGPIGYQEALPLTLPTHVAWMILRVVVEMPWRPRSHLGLLSQSRSHYERG